MEQANASLDDAQQAQAVTPNAQVVRIDAAWSVDAFEARRAEGPRLWFDSRPFIKPSEEDRALLARVFQTSFAGICLYPENFAELSAQIPARFLKVLHVESVSEWEKIRRQAGSPKKGAAEKRRLHAIASPDKRVLAMAKTEQWATCYRTRVDDAATLNASFTEGAKYDYLMIAFRDPTNIPLELVIASLQKTGTVLIKETGNDVDDAIVSLGVLEVGADGVMACFSSHQQIDEFFRKLTDATTTSLPLEEGTVVRTAHLGLGYRSCIDTTTLFKPDEGILVGSTSSGGILCCPEVFHLPYMDLRPFRVNAAAIHSYIYNTGDRTNYLSELRAGSPIMTVTTTGRTSRAFVGRIKTEIRPLLLIECVFSHNRSANIIVQDDWHVRVFSDTGSPLNVTEIKPGDKVLGYGTEPGRHVGIKVDEHIIEK